MTKQHRSFLLLFLTLLLAVSGLAQIGARSRVGADLSKKADRVTYCHYPGGDRSKGREHTTSRSGWENGHRDHSHGPGDVDEEGPCRSEPPPPDPVLGCTDSNALNYNPDATKDDGSCEYAPVVEGCTDSEATNYDPSATKDDGSCVFPPDPPIVFPGCTDLDATNYDPDATVDDGSCVFPPDPPKWVVGCKDPAANNTNDEADEDDRSLCTYDPEPPVVEPEEEDEKPAVLERFVLGCAKILSAIVGEEEVIPVFGIYSDGTKKPLSSGLRMRYLDGGQRVCIPGKGCPVTSFTPTAVVVEVWVDGLDQEPEEVTVNFFSKLQAPYTSTLGLFASEQQFDCKEQITTCVNFPDSYKNVDRIEYTVTDSMGNESLPKKVKVVSPDQGASVSLFIEDVAACTKPGRWTLEARLKDSVGNDLVYGTGEFFVKENPNSPIASSLVDHVNGSLVIFARGDLFGMIVNGVIQDGEVVHIAVVRSGAFIPLSARLKSDYLEVTPGSQGHLISLPSGYYTLLVYLETSDGVVVLSQPEAVHVPGGPDGDGRLNLN